MTEEQKRFKILKRESYEEQISQENKTATTKTFLFGLSAAAALSIFPAAAQLNIDTQLSAKIYETLLGIINTSLSVYQLKGLMETISRKTMLQGKVEDINTELEMLENKESRGMRR